ncbi:hypothetical protein K431DRAFT_287906 [Polychaeton citri CBS 116435]|uniref:Uncharacterized protein n=1 Tax=Polychaeton citri CBS 116435 TaxID=1314669 RepID=A0A9P4UMP7_9PEZI|nr:hypothetical protein K431DRAFT_287906 [Polychaeton citri CBS 116435]
MYAQKRYVTFLTSALLPSALAQSQGMIYFTTNPGTVGAPLTSTVSGSTGAADFAIGSSTYEATAVSGGKAVLAGYTLSPGGPAAMVGGTVISAASDGFVIGSSTVPYTRGSAGSIVTPTDSTVYSDGVTSVAGVASESASPEAASSTGLSSDGAVATGSWQGAAAALGGLFGVAALL